MSASVFKVSETGTGRVDASMTVPAGCHYELLSVTLHLNAAGTTSEDFTITLDANAGHVYDALLYSVDLSAASTTDVVWVPSGPWPLILEGGDAVDVAWFNTEGRTYGVEITMGAV